MFYGNNLQKTKKDNYPNKYFMNKLIVRSLLNISEIAYIARYVLEYCLALTATDTNLKALHDKLQLLYNKLLDSLEQSGKSPLTAILKSNDKTRDQAFICLRDQLGGASLSLNLERAAAAQKLYAKIEELGIGLYSQGYKAETTLLESLFKAFDKQNAQEKLYQLGLAEDYQALKEAQIAFATVQEERYQEQTADDNVGSAGRLTEEMLPVMENILAYLQLFSSMDAAAYKGTYDKIVTLVAGVNAIARARQTKRENTGSEAS